MKIKVKCSELKKQVDNCSRICSSAISPILANIKLKAIESELQLSSSDLEIFYKAEISAEVEQEGSIMIPANNLSDIINTIDGNEVLEIDTTEDLLVNINFGKSSYSIFGNNPDDYPNLPEHKESTSIFLPLSTLQDMIHKALYACSQDQSKKELTGVLMQGDGFIFRIVATDGRRMSKIEHEVKHTSFSDIVVPAKVLKEVLKMSGDNISIFFSKEQVQFVCGCEYISRIIDGCYPEYANVIPTAKVNTIKINNQELIKALKGVIPISKEVAFTIKCHFGKDTLEMSALSSKIGKGKRVIAIENDGEEITIAYNSRYMLDCLQVIDTNTVIFEPMSTYKATKIIPSEGNHINILMPVRMA